MLGDITRDYRTKYKGSLTQCRVRQARSPMKTTFKLKTNEWVDQMNKEEREGWSRKIREKQVQSNWLGHWTQLDMWAGVHHGGQGSLGDELTHEPCTCLFGNTWRKLGTFTLWDREPPWKLHQVHRGCQTKWLVFAAKGWLAFVNVDIWAIPRGRDWGSKTSLFFASSPRVSKMAASSTD